MKEMLELYQNIKKYRIAKKLTQDELAKLTGYTDRSSIAKIERGDVDLPQSKIALIAKALGVTPGTLMGNSGINLQTTTSHRIPVLGRVAAGVPISMVEDIIDFEEINDKIASLGEIFALSIKGDSMEPRILNGDVVIVHQQSDAESGDIVIATVNGDDATCKRLRKYRDGIELVPINPAYSPMYFSNEDIENLPVKILGKVIELRGKF